MDRTKTTRILGIAALGLTLAFAASASDDAAKKDQGKAAKKAGSKKAAAKAAGDKEKGEEVFKANNCAVCHYTDKTDKRIGPGLQGYFKREKMENGKPVNEDNTREIIMEGYGKMIPFKEKIDEKQLDDLIAYLKTL